MIHGVEVLVKITGLNHRIADSGQIKGFSLGRREFRRSSTLTVFSYSDFDGHPGTHSC